MDCFVLCFFIYQVCHGITLDPPLQWRHNDHDGVSNHQPYGCLLNCLFRRWSKKTSKLRVTGLRVGNWWRHHDLRPRQNGRQFTDNIFKLIISNGTDCVLILISLKFVFNGPVNNKPALAQIMDWHRTGHKPLSEPNVAQFTDAYDGLNL